MKIKKSSFFRSIAGAVRRNSSGNCRVFKRSLSLVLRGAAEEAVVDAVASEIEEGGREPLAEAAGVSE